MSGACASGVVVGGQVVLDAPLALADGTRVVVRAVEPTPPVGPDEPFRTEDERREAAEELILETVRTRAGRADAAEIERWVRALRGGE